MSFGAHVTSYQLQLGTDSAVLTLEGDPGHTLASGWPMARYEFREDAEPSALVVRSGQNQVERPMSMLSATMDMLRNDAPVFMGRDGELTAAPGLAEVFGHAEV